MPEAAGPSEPSLAELKYTYVPGPSGGRSDFVLRQIADPSSGFAWAGQENFNALGQAVFVWARERLVDLCGLEKLSGFEPAVPFATPGLADRAAPVLVLLPGDVPGGDCGTWSRRLCINTTTTSGAMFEYVFRAQDQGWSVLLADTNHATSPQKHMVELWERLLAPSKMTQLLMVGHSYGGPVATGLLKSEPAVCERLGAIACTDGMAWYATGWGGEDMIDERVPTAEEVARQADINENGANGNGAQSTGESRGEMEEMRARCEKFAQLVPAAFAPPSEAVRVCVARKGRNYVSSTLPVGSVLRLAPDTHIPNLSSGIDSHGDTTYSAIEHVFEFLIAGASGGASAANAALQPAAAPSTAAPVAPIPAAVEVEAMGPTWLGGGQTVIKRKMRRMCEGTQCIIC